MYQSDNFAVERDTDPLVAALTHVASRFGFDPAAGLFNMLPRTPDGRLPFHQAGAALDLIGLNYETHQLTRLPRRPEYYPALVLLADGDVAALLELGDGDVLARRAGAGEAQWIPLADLQQEFGGKLVTVTGDPDRLRNEGAPWHVKARSHWFWSELHKERRSFRPVVVASLLVNLLAVALPLFAMNVYDRVIPNSAEATLWVLATGVFLAFALEFSLRTARTAVIDRIGKRLDLRLSQKIFARLLATPLAGRRGSTGALAARVNEYNIVRDFFASTTVVTLVDVAFLVIFIAVIGYIAGWLAMIPLAAIVVMAIAGFILQRRVADAARDAHADHGLQHTMLVESVAGMETLKSASGERTMLGRWRGLAEMGSNSQLKLRRINAIAMALASSFQQICSVSLVIGGYYLFAAGQISMGAIIAIVMLASRALAPAGQIALLLTRGRQAKEALASIEELFAAEDERQQGTIAIPASPLGYTVKLENLSFAYPDTTTAALDDLDLTIRPGERVAVIGRVASGKSTLGRILCGLYQPTEGALYLNGIDSRQFRPTELRDKFRFVGQDANLFTGSIRDNIALGLPGAKDHEVISAMGRSGADVFLARDAAGFGRQVGEQGRRLSGGQRAFLALSRAFVSDCELLFLDEPTGAMDSQTEKLVVERLQQGLSEKQTLVVSTHRPALFALCQRIIVMDQGRIVADGPKELVLSQRTGQQGGK